MMKTILLFLLVVSFIFMSGCVQRENIQISEDDNPSVEIKETSAPIQEDQKILPEPPDVPLVERVKESEPKKANIEPKPGWLFQSWWGNCEDKTITFTNTPIDPVIIKVIEPIGKMHSGHVTPTDHMYILSNREGQIKALADGYITKIERHGYPAVEGTITDYRIEIWYSCKVSSLLMHVVDLSEDIHAAAGEFQNNQWFPYPGRPPISLKAGQVIGKSEKVGLSLWTFDFSIHDTSIMINYITPERYATEPWKIHTADAFDYFAEPIRSQLLEKNPRTANPRGGKIDYDIDGRLVGNWFLEGTIDYSGSGGNYWENHLAIAYDYINSQEIQISIGNYEGGSAQFGVKGNTPDPKDVGVDSGLVKYELVERDYIAGKWPQKRNIESSIVGVFLVQMLEDRKLKVEAFPGKTASQVSGFTSNAKIYER